MANSKNTEKELRESIFKHLKNVTAHTCPRIHKRIQTQAGYAQIEQMIIYMMVNDGIEVSACIPQIESEL